jgi:hypothetical protein
MVPTASTKTSSRKRSSSTRQKQNQAKKQRREDGVSITSNEPERRSLVSVGFLNNITVGSSLIIFTMLLIYYPDLISIIIAAPKPELYKDNIARVGFLFRTSTEKVRLLFLLSARKVGANSQEDCCGSGPLVRIIVSSVVLLFVSQSCCLTTPSCI